MKKIILCFATLTSINPAFAFDPVEHSSKVLTCKIEEYNNRTNQSSEKALNGDYYADVVKDGKIYSEGGFELSYDSIFGGSVQVAFYNRGENRIVYRPKKDSIDHLAAISKAGLLVPLQVEFDLGAYEKGTGISISCAVKDKK